MSPAILMRDQPYRGTLARIPYLPPKLKPGVEYKWVKR